MKKLLFVAALALAVAPLGAKIYKSVLPDGTVVYSDTPPASDAKPVELPRIQTYTPAPVPSIQAPQNKSEKNTFQGYDTFEVTSPANDATVRDNAGTVSVSLSLSPGLRNGHKVEIFMDGQSIGSGAATTASVTNIDRGTHSIHAVVRDADGKEVIRTANSVFHLQKVSRLTPRRPQPRRGGS